MLLSTWSVDALSRTGSQNASAVASVVVVYRSLLHLERPAALAHRWDPAEASEAAMVAATFEAAASEVASVVDEADSTIVAAEEVMEVVVVGMEETVEATGEEEVEAASAISPMALLLKVLPLDLVVAVEVATAVVAVAEAMEIVVVGMGVAVNKVSSQMSSEASLSLRSATAHLDQTDMEAVAAIASHLAAVCPTDLAELATMTVTATGTMIATTTESARTMEEDTTTQDKRGDTERKHGLLDGYIHYFRVLSIVLYLSLSPRVRMSNSHNSLVRRQYRRLRG